MTDNKKIEIISNICELLEFVKNNNNLNYLIAFDMDDTLICGEETLGSDMWLNKSMKKGRQLSNILNDMDYVYSFMIYRTVEPDTIDVVTKLISYPNVDYLILTRRGMRHYSQTIKHLKESGLASLIRSNVLDINSTAFENTLNTHSDMVGVGDGDGDCQDKTVNGRIRYIDNICFCSGYEKDVILEELINLAYISSPKKRYDTIVVIDDSIQDINRIHNRFLRSSSLRKSLFNKSSTHSIHYSFMEIIKRRYSDGAFQKDNRTLRTIKNTISYVNGKTIIDYVISVNVLLSVSLLWWFVFRFLGIII
jgi:hypothetical protein